MVVVPRDDPDCRHARADVRWPDLPAGRADGERRRAVEGLGCPVVIAPLDALSVWSAWVTRAGSRATCFVSRRLVVVGGVGV